MIIPVSDTPELTGKNIAQSLFFSGVHLDPSKISLYQKPSHQEFVREDILVNKSIDPYQHIINANKIISAGESLFLNETTMNKRK